MFSQRLFVIVIGKLRCRKWLHLCPLRHANACHLSQSGRPFTRCGRIWNPLPTSWAQFTSPLLLQTVHRTVCFTRRALRHWVFETLSPRWVAFLHCNCYSLVKLVAKQTAKNYFFFLGARFVNVALDMSTSIPLPCLAINLRWAAKPKRPSCRPQR